MRAGGAHLDALLLPHDAEQRRGRPQVLPHVPPPQLQLHALALQLGEIQDARQDLQQPVGGLPDGERQPALLLGEGRLEEEVRDRDDAWGERSRGGERRGRGGRGGGGGYGCKEGSGMRNGKEAQPEPP